ncbi:hypothetical protein [Lentilactobacillus sunkii]|jgi:hypothetical protein|nr:hypothetical protein [Lentilactobacillus sunkii]OFA09880.1 hypothetical protein LASUN_23620 [Lentilactobacillus sunkii]
MTTIYVDPSKKKEQIVKLSDGTFGLMKAEKQKSGIGYEFDFTSHMHPSFEMQHAPVNGDEETVHSIDGEQQFKIQWLSKS